MPRPARPWFRFYVEAVNDPKLDELTPAQKWSWVVLLAAARESPRPGWLLRAEGVPWRLDALARRAGVKVKEATAGFAEMSRLGMLAESEGCWTVPRWNDRQFESDDVTARVQRWRERDSNVSATAVATPPETEAETDEIPPTPLADFEPPLEQPKAENGNSADREQFLDEVVRPSRAEVDPRFKARTGA